MIELKTGDVILVHTPFNILDPVTWLSALIRIFDKTYYNHCKLVVCNWNVPFINEALGVGIRTSPAEYNLEGKTIIVRRPKAPIKERGFAIKANSFIGVSKYDYDGTFIKQLIYQTTGYWIKGKKDKNTNRFYCSEYDAYMYDMPNWWEVSPRDLLKSELFETIYQN